jgi:hypothetical protein
MPRSGLISITMGVNHGIKNEFIPALKGLNLSIDYSTPSGLYDWTLFTSLGLHPRLFKLHPFRVLNIILGSFQLLIRMIRNYFLNAFFKAFDSGAVISRLLILSHKV